jgi:hypothetical protein
MKEYKFTTTFRHFRWVEGKLLPYGRKHKHHSHQRPDPKGGITVCAMTCDEGTFIGVATCSREDAFCYLTGRIKATQDAMEQHGKLVKGRQQ